MSWRTYNFTRTTGDSISQAIQIIVRQIDGEEVPIEDATVVTMHILTDPVTLVSSTHQGLENGIRFFNGTTLSAIDAGSYAYEIQVEIDGDDWTPIKGQVQFFEEIA